MSSNETYIDVERCDSSIQAHLGILQSVIQRMASNSTACNAWCITLVSAVLVLVVDKGNPDYVLIAFIPVILFLFLDAYYLALEKSFRNTYNDFISKLHRKSLTFLDLYSVSPKGSMSSMQLEAFRSFSVWGFYCSLGFLICVVNSLLIK
jgi:hypothetical protein